MRKILSNKKQGVVVIEKKVDFCGFSLYICGYSMKLLRGHISAYTVGVSADINPFAVS